jgi:hypothetical protein
VSFLHFSPSDGLVFFRRYKPQKIFSQTVSFPPHPQKLSSICVARCGKPPLSFEANQGQVNGVVKFLSRGPGYALFLTGDEALLEILAGRRASRNPKVKIA